MKPRPSWAENFKINETTWADVCSQAVRQNTTPLSVALDLGLLNENKVLEFERDKSGIPTLHGVFFNGPPPVDLWKNENLLRCKASACMPLGQWDGNIYWAKIESSLTGIEGSLNNAVWVLAPWTSMKRWFTVWENMVKGATPTPIAPVIAPQVVTPAMEMPVGMAPLDLGIPQAGTNAIPPNPFDAMAATLPTEPSKSEEKTASFDAPAGLSIGAGTTPSVSIDFSGIGVANSEQPTTTHSAGTLSHTAPADPNPSPLMMAPLQTPQSQPVSQPPPPPPQVATNPAMNIPRPAWSTPPPVAMPPPPVVTQSVMPPPPMMAPPPMPIIDTPASTSTANMSGSQDETAFGLMKSWQGVFDKMMILLFQGENLIVWKWSGQWMNPQIQSGQVIPINQPSIFKIVADTARPYHGYVAPGTVNDHFFQVTNAGQYPDHVTILPMIAGGKVIGQIFGATSKSTGQTIRLNDLERAAQTFTDMLTVSTNSVRKAV